MSTHTMSLTPALTDYLHQVGVQEDALLRALREETAATFEASPMQISPEQGQLFRFLIKLLNVKNALEIGTFTGYSAASIAMALPDDGHLVCCDSSRDWTRLAVKYWEKMGLSHKISLTIGPTLNKLDTLIEEDQLSSFDFAFIDADKPNYGKYYEYCLRLVRPGGIIAIDNVLWDGKVIDPDNQDLNTCVIRSLNQSISQDPRVNFCMLPIGDGLTLVQKRTVEA